MAYAHDLGKLNKALGVGAGAELRVSTARGPHSALWRLEGGGSGPEFQ